MSFAGYNSRRCSPPYDNNGTSSPQLDQAEGPLAPIFPIGESPAVSMFDDRSLPGSSSDCEEKVPVNVKSMEHPIVSQWKIGWRTPLLMYGLFVSALIVATIHLGLFLYLDGKPANGEHEIPQTYVSAASQLLARVFSATLCASLAVAFVQHLWRVLRTKPVKVSDIDTFFGLRDNLFLFANPGPTKTAPLLVLLALTTWLVPIAMIYPPGALVVVPTSISKFVNTTVPTFDASFAGNHTYTDMINNAIAHLKWGPSTQYIDYAGDRVTTVSLAQSSLSTGAVVAVESPCGANCSFNLLFDGPYLKCDSNFQALPSTLQRLPKRYSGSPEKYLPAHIAFSANRSGNVPSRVDFNVSNLIGATEENPNTIWEEVNQLQCTAARATYDVQILYTDGVRTIKNTQYVKEALSWQSSSLPQPTNLHSPPKDFNWTSWRDLNLYSMVSAFSEPLLGTVPEVKNVFDMPVNFTSPNGTVIRLLPAITDYWTLQMADYGYGSFFFLNNFSSNAAETVLNIKRYDLRNLTLDLHVSETLLNEALANFTFNAMYTFGVWNTTVEAKVTNTINTYSFAVRRNLLLPYLLSLAGAIPFLILATFSMRANGVSALGGFLQTIMTTTGSKTLHQAAAGGCLGGKENIPDALLDLKLQFGELVGVPGCSSNRVKRAGLGTEDEVVPLTGSSTYGV